MNRRPADAYDSGDSASDWDTTVAESPERVLPPPKFNNITDNPEGDYATVIPKTRNKLKDGIVANSERLSKATPKTTPRKEKRNNDEDPYSLPSPPPHLSSFQNALSDYSEVHDQGPQIPPRKYDFEGKGQMYKVGDSVTPAVPPVTVNWDDSDADEEILRELRQNIDKEKLKQEAKQEALAQEKLGTSFLVAENQGYAPSPRSIRSQKSTADRRFNERKEAITTPRPKIAEPPSHQNNGKEENIGPLHLEPVKKKKAMIVSKKDEVKEPVMVRDLTGKKCVYYFDEGSHHLLEVIDDDMEAFLPEKIDEVEKLFKRVWREVFSIFRIVTSFFVFFITEFIFYLINYVFQPLVLDSLSAIGNHLIKPLMTIIFNHIWQPVFALIWNILNAITMAISPLMQLLSNIVNQVVLLLQSVRLFNVTVIHNSSGKSVEIV